MNKLDFEEHFYLALNAISEGNHERAIIHLKAIEKGDYYCKAQYLLAAEYAEIRMYDKAKHYFELVIHDESVGKMALLQKGVLHIFLGELSEAKSSLMGVLDKDDEEGYLSWFARGLIYSLDGQEEDAIKALETGIDLNKVNDPLNDDIRKYIDYALNKSPEKLSILSKEIESKGKQSSNKFFLNNYEEN